MAIDEQRRALARATRPARRRWRQTASWQTGLPDFAGVGAQRCGTSWWWRILGDHPRTHPGEGKELQIFDGRSRRALKADDVAAYQALFRRPPGMLVGESSPPYMHDFWTLGLLRQAAPRARILGILRGPLRRYQSGLAHYLRSLPRKVRRRRRGYVEAMAANDALSRCLYARQIRRLLEHFNREQLLVLQYERCAEHPLEEAKPTYAFLGRDPSEHTPELALVYKCGPRYPAAQPPPRAVAAQAISEIRRDAAELATLAPELDLEHWPSCHGEGVSGQT